MTLRCRPGDLALVVRSEGPNLWLLVLVLRAHERRRPGVWWVRCLGHGKTRLSDVPPGGVASVTDEALRPIRPDAEPVERDEPALGDEVGSGSYGYRFGLAEAAQ